MTNTSIGLPTWDEMSDLDKGAALLHLHKRDWEGVEYAIAEYAAEYFDDERLTGLSRQDASAHAVQVCGGDVDAFTDRIGSDQFVRLYDLALAADSERTRARIRANRAAPAENGRSA